MPRRRSQSGQAIVLVAVALLALIGSAALVLLAGSAASQRNQLQSLADTSALDSALKIGIGCNAAGATSVITEADNFLATLRTRTGSLAIAAGTCATPYHGTDTFSGGLSADYYYPYRGHQQQVEVSLTLSLPISFGGVVGTSSTNLTRYAVAQALPASVPAITATTVACTGGQVNVLGNVLASNLITLSGGCAIYAHDNPTSGAYSGLGNVRVYADGQSWTGAGGSCAAGASSGSTNAICADGYELSGHTAPACSAGDFLSAGIAAIDANPCAAGVGPQPVPPLSTTLPPDPNADPAAIATLQGTGGSACTSGGAYPTIIAGGITWGTGLAPAPTKDASGFWHFKPSCYGYLDFTNASAGGITSKQIGPESTRATHNFVGVLPAPSTAGTLLVATVNSDDTPNKFTAPAGWIEAVEVDTTPDRRTEIWYYPSNPGGITTGPMTTFTVNPATISGEVQISEWSGVAAVAPLDQTGTFAAAVATTTATTSTTGALAQTGELVVTNMGFLIPGGQTYTKGAGWNATVSDAGNGFASEYRLDLPAAVASETVTTSQASQWANVIASFKPAAAAGGGAVLDPGFYYFNGSGFGAGGGGLCLNGGTLLARDVTLEFVNQAGLSSGTCVLGGGLGCVTGACKFGSDPVGALSDTSYSWFSAPCSQDPSASPPDVSCLGASSWCPAGDRSCWNLLVYTPAAGSTGQLALKGASANQWLLGSMYWSGTCTVAVNGDSTIAGSLACGSLSISAGAGAGTAVGGDYGVNTATVEAILVE